MKKYLFFIIACVALSSCTSKSKKVEAKVSTFSMNELESTIGSTGTPERLSGVIMQLQNPEPAPEVLALLQQEAIFKLNMPEDELRLVKNEKDELGYQHLSFGRVHDGIDIWGDELKFHINDKNELYLFNGHYQPSLPENFSTSSTLTNREAEDAARQALSLAFANEDETKLFIFPSDSSYKMTWRVVVGKTRLSPDQWECLVDAQSGAILYKSNLIRSH